MPSTRRLALGTLGAALGLSLTACAGPTEFNSADELVALVEATGVECNTPVQLGNYYFSECEHVRVEWSSEINNDIDMPKRAAGRGGIYDSIGQMAIKDRTWLVVAGDTGEGMGPGNAIVEQLGEKTNTKPFLAYW